ncbi:MAG: type II toxin-antitoxin system prevent-host-death family antitoxin [Acidobacteria bacterium]|nr:type II toxin-antitoxin system prevent-host-death family antitoxin [Acidobacteriota bacterium]
MKSVMIAELKARLSEYLAEVRRGQQLTVLNRDTPIARIVPYTRETTRLTIRRPAPGSLPPHRVPLPLPLATDLDIVGLLLEERRVGR